VGVALGVAAFSIRAMMTPVLGGLAPYATVFIGTALAAVIAGWRSGLVTLLLGQTLVAIFILDPVGGFSLANEMQRTTFVVAAISEMILLLIIGLYQREVDKGVAERERRLHQLDQALNEIDHRTRNNYQTVLALVHMQAQRAGDRKIAAALHQVGDRIQAIASASERLALKSGDIDKVRLDEHLCELCEQIERGLTREEIDLACEIDSVTANSDKAVSISIIVNELVTNAIKHAFNGEGSGNVWVIGRAGSKFELLVRDDGRGIRATRASNGNGLGTKLVESFVRQLDAHHEVVSTEEGTTHRLLIPNLG
jgi:two-component sensor histidine kinase